LIKFHHTRFELANNTLKLDELIAAEALGIYIALFPPSKAALARLPRTESHGIVW
jgi:hypothetical protein